MKFLNILSAKYDEYRLEKPQWLTEYTATPVTPVTTSPTIGQTLQKVGTAVAGATPTGGVVTALMKAMDVLQDDPDVQKVKANVTQKVADVKKQITDAGTKALDTLTKAVDGLQKTTTSTNLTSPNKVS